MTEGQYKELVEFLEEGKMEITALKSINANTVELRVIKRIDENTSHYIIITIPMTKES